MIVSVLSDIGASRANNEDALYASLDKSLPLYIVADGMGGHNAGDIASNMAIEIIKDEFILNKEKLKSPRKIEKAIKTSFEKANKLIYQKSLHELDLEGMGTTVVLGYYFDNSFYIGHVGDSRAYILEDDSISQITEDHTLVNELIKKGSITKSQALHHPQRNYITRALGTSRDIEIDINIADFSSKETMLLCSDGLYNMIEEDTIVENLNRASSLDEGVSSLVKIANENGGKDNITIIAIKLDDEVLEWLEKH